MTEGDAYKKAYERQKVARERAELALEVVSRELYTANEKVTEAYNRLKEQKEKIVLQEKLASIGFLAAGVAHEINSPVGFVKGNLQALKGYSVSFARVVEASQVLNRKVSASEYAGSFKPELEELQKLIRECDFDFIVGDAIQAIDESLNGVARVQEITSQLTGYSRSGMDEQTLLQLNEVIETSIKLVWGELRHKVDICKDYGAIPSVMGSAGKLSQVFVNILVNASQSIEKRGRISIRTFADENNVYAEISDSGPGIPEEIMSKIFDPFFTSKSIGAGTGLGLYVSYDIINSHRGLLSAKNLAAGGASFTVSLRIERQTAP
jgi:two-component system NtrC family sensor kinase